jgi:hypothetical protein
VIQYRESELCARISKSTGDINAEDINCEVCLGERKFWMGH